MTMVKVVSLMMAMMLIQLPGCRSGVKSVPKDLFDRENLVAWCIVPFDAAERTPEQRAGMLEELGITRLAYDYRDRHLASFEEEIRTLKEHGIRLQAVWLWVEPQGEGLLNTANETVLEILERTGTHTELWVSFPAWVFGGTGEENLETAIGAVKEVLRRAEEIGCTVALYNHGDWFGEPENQVRIIETIGSDHLKMVYNFHHGHNHMDRFGELFPLMLPHLSAVNINGMSSGGPKIITLGDGEKELQMLRVLRASGYDGPLGIIGHTEGEDIRVVLERNLKGLEKLKQSL
ncbi:MAG TPA: AP endonuclease [Bacteroides sp.]|nr:AP endonuclease [Bacteroides sp.]